MRPVSDELLLNVAVISATLLGLLVVGVFFYVETGLRRLEHGRGLFEPFIRAAARLTMTFYAASLVVSLALVALEPAWARAAFVVAGVGMVLTTIDWTIRARNVGKVVGPPSVWSSIGSLPQQVFTWVWVGAVIAIPWILGGLRPSREELMWGILLALLTGLLSTLSILLSVFDVAEFERTGHESSTGLGSEEGSDEHGR
jgi:hypothetical protein